MFTSMFRCVVGCHRAHQQQHTSQATIHVRTLLLVGTSYYLIHAVFTPRGSAPSPFALCLLPPCLHSALHRSCLCMCRPKNMRVSAFIHQPPSLRSATLYNSMMSVSP